MELNIIIISDKTRIHLYDFETPQVDVGVSISLVSNFNLCYAMLCYISSICSLLSNQVTVGEFNVCGSIVLSKLGHILYARMHALT